METHDANDQAVRDQLAAGNLTRATELALHGHGREVFGFLCTLERDDDRAADAFAQLTEDVWRGLSGFTWQCSLRTWMYTLARNASHRLHRGVKRIEVPLSQAPELAQVVRTQTQSFMRSEAKDKLAQIRAMLPPEDEALLILRVDKNLEWNELARVLSGASADGELKRESARLRKRFQLLKEKLVALGQKEGLLPER
jgi:RNA polymerase sigma-70 factor (ECF subfamily)